MRSLFVVVIDVFDKHAIEMSATCINVQSRHSVRTVRTKRSAKALARGARTGVRITSVPSLRNTSSKVPENLASRSRIKNRIGYFASARSPVRFRACCVTQVPFGDSVTPAR